MSTERCVHLTLVGLANHVKEMWIAEQPFLLFCYMWQYTPTLAWYITKVLGRKRVQNFKAGLVSTGNRSLNWFNYATIAVISFWDHLLLPRMQTLHTSASQRSRQLKNLISRISDLCIPLQKDPGSLRVQNFLNSVTLFQYVIKHLKFCLLYKKHRLMAIFFLYKKKKRADLCILCVFWINNVNAFQVCVNKIDSK